MSVGRALAGGVRSLNSRKPLWFWFYGMTTLWALAIVAPVMAILFSFLGSSAWTERMAGNFDLQVIGELIFSKSVLASAPMLAAMIAIAVVAAVSHLFLAGGALEFFWSEEPFSTGAFFRGCGRYFWRLVRLALLIALLCVAVAIANSVLSRIGNKVWGEGSVETPLVYWSWFRVASVLLMFGFVNLVSDYARIWLVANDARSAWRSAIASLRFVFRNFARTVGLYSLTWLILLAVLAIYRGLEGAIGQSTLGLALVLLIVRQVTVLIRIWVQLLFYTSETELYRRLTPEPIPELPPAALMI